MATHAWMPSSPCGTSCLPTDGRRVRAITIVARWMLAVLVLGSLPVLVLARFLPVGARRAVVSTGARTLLFAVGIRLDVHGRTDDRGRGTLVVANHVSWTDALVLAAVFPARFVARADLVDWPVLGWLARAVRVVPVDRDSLRTLPGTVGTVRDLLDEGSTVVVFPEGTTWCGTAYGTFRPAFFQAAIDAGCAVQPVSVRYRDERGPTTATGFVGDETMGASVARIIRLGGLRAAVTVCEPLLPSGDRRSLAARAEDAVRGTESVRVIAGRRVTSDPTGLRPAPTGLPAAV